MRIKVKYDYFGKRYLFNCPVYIMALIPQWKVKRMKRRARINVMRMFKEIWKEIRAEQTRQLREGWKTVDYSLEDWELDHDKEQHGEQTQHDNEPKAGVVRSCARSDSAAGHLGLR